MGRYLVELFIAATPPRCANAPKPASSQRDFCGLTLESVHPAPEKKARSVKPCLQSLGSPGSSGAYARRTFTAWGPFGESSISKVTSSASLKVRNPSPSMLE